MLLAKEKEQFSHIQNGIDILLSMKRTFPVISKVEPTMDKVSTTDEGKSFSMKVPNVESYNMKRTRQFEICLIGRLLTFQKKK